jgi:quercetin dioxygenase-like cupin family protein
MIKTHLRIGLYLAVLSLSINGQATPKPSLPTSHDVSATERELREFYDKYREDLVKQRREEIANRYDPRGYFSVGNGRKELVSFEENKRRYLKDWTGPKAFEWRDLSYEILSPTAAAVVGLGEWTAASGQKIVLSYTALLTKQAGQWRIRVEDESVNSSGTASKTISGDRNTPGVWKYTFTAQPGASIAAHRHTSEMRITVKNGRKFILMGDLETAKVQRFEAGSTFVIPANTWHVEWWETETVEEIEITAPTRTERATPATPRVL